MPADDLPIACWGSMFARWRSPNRHCRNPLREVTTVRRAVPGLRRRFGGCFSLPRRRRQAPPSGRRWQRSAPTHAPAMPVSGRALSSGIRRRLTGPTWRGWPLHESRRPPVELSRGCRKLVGCCGAAEGRRKASTEQGCHERSAVHSCSDCHNLRISSRRSSQRRMFDSGHPPNVWSRRSPPRPSAQPHCRTHLDKVSL